MSIPKTPQQLQLEHLHRQQKIADDEKAKAAIRAAARPPVPLMAPKRPLDSSAAIVVGDDVEIKQEKKKKKTTPVVMYQKKVEEKPTAHYMKQIVDFLKAHRSRNGNNYYDAAQIMKGTASMGQPGVDINADEDLRLNLNNNLRVEVKGDTYAYKPKFSAMGQEEIKNEINKIPNGTRRSYMMDSYLEVEKDIDDLVRQRDIICIKNSEKKQDDVLYPRLPLYGKSNLPDDIKELWNGVRIPDQIDLQRSLVGWGLKSSEDNAILNGKKVQVEEKKETQKKRHKRKFVRITNKHIPGFNLDEPVNNKPKDPNSTSTW